MSPRDSKRTTRRIIKSFEAGELKKRPLHVKFADSLTLILGTTGFLVFNLGIFIFWVVANQGKIPGIPVFDPFPYFLLTTGVSLEAIMLSIIVLVSENRQNQVNSIKSELELQVSLITEREITMLLRLTKALLDKEGVKVTDPELEEMLKDTDTSYIQRRIEKQLTENPSAIIEKVARPIEDEVKRLYKGEV